MAILYSVIIICSAILVGIGSVVIAKEEFLGRWQIIVFVSTLIIFLTRSNLMSINETLELGDIFKIGALSFASAVFFYREREKKIKKSVLLSSLAALCFLIAAMMGTVDGLFPVSNGMDILDISRDFLISAKLSFIFLGAINLLSSSVGLFILIEEWMRNKR